MQCDSSSRQRWAFLKKIFLAAREHERVRDQDATLLRPGHRMRPDVRLRVVAVLLARRHQPRPELPPVLGAAGQAVWD